VRRAGDVLATHGARRLGYLGWSSGAKTGTFVAASDSRFAALALLSAGAATVEQFVQAAPPALRAKVRRGLVAVDPIRYVAFARPGTLLLEDGTHDTVVPRSALENIVRAAPKGTSVRWYPTGHALDAAAYRAAIGWLASRLRR
jgi:dienelactone hydrolase